MKNLLKHLFLLSLGNSLWGVTDLEREFWIATFRGEVGAAVSLICKDKDININLVDTEAGWTPLHNVVRCGCETLVRMLLKRPGINVNAVDHKGWSPLRHAIEVGQCGKLNIIEMLLFSPQIYVDQPDAKGNTPLHSASCGGSVEVVKLLVEKNANCNARNKLGLTPLIYLVQVIKPECQEAIRLFLQNGASMNDSKNEHKRAPLHQAVLVGNVDAVALLLDLGGDIEIKGHNGRTPLHYAARFAQVASAKLLLNRGASFYAVDQSGLIPLVIAQIVLEKDAEFFETSSVLELEKKNSTQKATVGRRGDMSCGNDKTHALMLLCRRLLSAVKNNDLQAIEMCREQGIDLNMRNDNGDTQLHLAAYENNCEIAKVLINNGADINALNKDRSTALRVAVRANNYEITKLLINKGVDVDVINKDGSAAPPIVRLQPQELFLLSKQFLIAVEEDDSRAIERCREHGIDLNMRNDNGNTQLHLAAYENNCEIAEVLINNGADINAIDEDGSTALHIAAYLNHPEMAELLIKKGVDKNKPNKQDGQTPLHVAARWGNFAIASLLIDNKAQIDLLDKNNCKPVDLAELYPKTVELLTVYRA